MSIRFTFWFTQLKDSLVLALLCGILEKYTLWKFIVDVVDDFGSSLWPYVSWGFLHVSNVFLFSSKMWKKKIFISFPTLACQSEVMPRGTQVIAQSLKTRQQNGPKREIFQMTINTCLIDIFIRNVVAVAAYSRLTSRSQAKFQTMKLSPLSAPLRILTCAEHCIHLSFTSLFASLVYGCESDTHCPSGLSQAFFEARNEVGWWLLTSLVSRSQEWVFFHVTFDIKHLLFRLVWKVVRCLSTKQDGGTTWPVSDGRGTPNRTARHHGTGRLRSVTGPAGWRLSREAQLKFPTRRRMTGRLGGWRVSRGARLGSGWRARDRGRPSKRCWPSTWWWRPGRCGRPPAGVTSQLSRVPQQGTLQLQDMIHPCFLMSAVCSSRHWPKRSTGN